MAEQPVNQQEYYRQISHIIGIDVTLSGTTLHFIYTNRDEAITQLGRIRDIQQQLRFLKRDVRATVSEVKSKFATVRVNVGNSFGAAIAASVIGRRTVGRLNAARRDDLRRNQLAAVAPYTQVSKTIDHVLYELDLHKRNIQLSPEYRSKSSRTSRSLPPTSLCVPKPKDPCFPESEPTEYYIRVRDQVKGPYTRPALRSLLLSGEITAQTLCCTRKDLRWRAFGELSSAA